MTLTVKSKPPAHHKKLSGNHHRRSKTYHKAYWPYLPIIAIVLGGLFLNGTMPVPGRPAVLAYATDMSVQGLLDGTNGQRTNNGLNGLSLNAQLDQAAQAKANDMVARDYWSHNTPDGQTPWTFMSAAGYNYQTAGENLAYGFDSSSYTITGWMNSPGHRANILNTSYLEVGFGIANSPNYQNSGPETVVVAMYGSQVGSAAPVSSPAAPTSAPATSNQSTSSPSQPSAETPAAASGQPAASDSTPTTPAEQPTVPEPTSPVSSQTPVPTATAVKPITETKPQSVTRMQLLTAGKAPWSVSALTILLASGMLIFFTRHGIAWHKVIRKGERFFLRHPALDIAATLFIVIGLLLMHSVGTIR